MNKFYSFFDYHEQTKHSYLSVRLKPNRLDWDNQPSTYKLYPDTFERIQLNTDIKNHDFLYLIAGINAKKSYPGVEYYLRMNPSAGALYPNEIYFQVRNEEGFKDGIYHYEVLSSSMTLLYELKNHEGIEKNLELDYSYDGFIFFLSSIYFRSSWKYKNRAFRYCLLDAGHILGSIEISSYIYEKDFFISYDFDKDKLNQLFNFDKKEFFTSLVFCGNKNKKIKKELILKLPCIDGYKNGEQNATLLYEKNEIIEKAYNKSKKISKKIVQLHKANYRYDKDRLKEVIFKRRSVRSFFKKSISKAQFESILEMLTQAISSDCDELVDIYYVINRVESYALGLYKDNKCIKKADLQSHAGYLCLEQDLGKSSAVTFFLATKSSNYQEAYQKAGIIGHRLYLASNYLNIGCSGIGAYYDDEVNELIGENSMILYALAIGN